MKKVFVGLSGGVDSAVAAYLLKKQGYEVACGFMRNWDSFANGDFEGNPTIDESVCPQEQDYNDAKNVAELLDLPLYRVDFIKEYWDDVFQTFLTEYKKGRTPNPDILCNRYIKFNSFMKYAKELGFDTVATGHYAKIGFEDGVHVLQKADDRNKDQSYFLAEIQREVLKDVIFPLGTIDKPGVRRIAEELALPIAKKKDSTGICFIGERDFRRFLSNYLPMKPGKIINIVNHQIVGEHKGVLYYTIGQRKGLDIGGTGPYYVIGKDVEKNELYVTDEHNQQWLYADSCMVTGLNIFKDFDEGIACHAKFRYRQPDQDILIERKTEDTLYLRFPKEIRSITPGQEAVIYVGDTVVAGGKIEHAYKDGEDLHEKINKEAEKAI